MGNMKSTEQIVSSDQTQAQDGSGNALTGAATMALSKEKKSRMATVTVPSSPYYSLAGQAQASVTTAPQRIETIVSPLTKDIGKKSAIATRAKSSSREGNACNAAPDSSFDEQWPLLPSMKQDVLQGLRERTEAFLRENEDAQIKFTLFETNVLSLPGNPLYERFEAALQKNYYDPSEGGAIEPLQLCFHGTASEHVDSILVNGLDPARRSRQTFGKGEYFGGTPRTCMPYCCGGRRLIVFAVISRVAARVDNSDLSKEIIRVDAPDHHLPIGTAHF